MPKICEWETCSKQSSYGAPGGGPRWCVDHAPSGAENVAHRKCEGRRGVEKRKPCKKKPTFAKATSSTRWRARWCSDCAPEDAVDVTHGTCRHKGGEERCRRQPQYAEAPGEPPSWCTLHRPPRARYESYRRCAYHNCTRMARVGGEGAHPLWCKAHLPEEGRASAPPKEEPEEVPPPPVAADPLEPGEWTGLTPILPSRVISTSTPAEGSRGARALSHR